MEDQEEPEILSEGDDFGMDSIAAEFQEAFGLGGDAAGTVFVQRRQRTGGLWSMYARTNS